MRTAPPIPDSRPPARAARRGSVLVEFALIAFALYLVIASIVELGRIVLSAQVIQGAADTMARELASAPLGATLTFDQALADPYVKARIFDERHLVVSLADHPPGPALDAHFAGLPIVNQMLRPVMVSDELAALGPVLRYPGAVVQSTDADGAYYTVLVPRVIGRDAQGIETLDWLRAVEEVLPEASGESHFGIDAPLQPFRGLASVRVNYPYQAATLTAYQGPGISSPVIADDGGVNAGSIPGGSSLVGGGAGTGPNAGTYGLGQHYALLGQSVRPYRKLLSAQAVRRREVVLPN